MGATVKILCTICARGDSQGVKNKNIISVCKKPLIAHSILQAKKSQLFDSIAVSSDSEKIRNVAQQWGADYLIDRPTDLATSTAAKLPVIQHAVIETEKLTGIQYEVVVDLDATSPLRFVEDIQNSLGILLQHKEAENVITGCCARKSPYFNLVESGKNGYIKLCKKLDAPVVRRQDAPLCYDMNASIYIWRRDALFNNSCVISGRTLLYVMPEERSVDIDSLFDLKMVRFLARGRKDLQ